MRYFFFGYDFRFLGHTRALIYSGADGTTRVLTTAEVHILLACTTLLTLEEHTARCCTVIHPDLLATLELSHSSAGNGGAADAAPVEHRVHSYLSRCAEEGLLTSEEGLHARILTEGNGASAPRNNTVTCLSIPTRDRIAVVERALRSYLDNDVRFDRQTVFIVLDDSSSQGTQRTLRRMLRDLQWEYGRTLRYSSRRSRAGYASRLATHAGVPMDVVHFALVGDRRCPTSYGATRNALLLDTVGELCLQVDDDTVCTVSRPPSSARALHVTSKYDGNAYWFTDTLHDALSQVTTVPRDFISLHEEVLGKSPASHIAAAVRAGVGLSLDLQGGSEVLTNTFGSDRRIGVSFAGIVGDCGGPGRHHWKLELEGASFERLVADGNAFQSRLFSRTLVKCAEQWTLSDGSYCMGGNMGLDNRALQPPFMPVQVAEDTVAGAIRRAALRQMYAAFIPFSIRHDPSPPRTTPAEPVPLAFIVNVILLYVICQFTRTSSPAYGADTLRQLGYFVREIGRLHSPAFVAFIKDATYSVLSARAAQLDNLLYERHDAPAYWKRGVERYCADIRDLVAREDPSSPSDLPGDPASRRRLFQDLTRSFGEVLIHWPDMMKAAGELRDAGSRLSQPV